MCMWHIINMCNKDNKMVIIVIIMMMMIMIMMMMLLLIIIIIIIIIIMIITFITNLRFIVYSLIRNYSNALRAS